MVNLTPEQYQKYKHHSFDSYIKKSLKREARRGYREISRRLGFEVSLESLPEEAMDDLSFTDFYPCEYCSFFVADAVIIVENEALACALERLHPEERNLILMHWFLDMTDEEIARSLCIARRTVNDHRRKSYQKLKEWMRGGLCE